LLHFSSFFFATAVPTIKAHRVLPIAARLNNAN